jgi:hypothetical protein
MTVLPIRYFPQNCVLRQKAKVVQMPVEEGTPSAAEHA